MKLVLFFSLVYDFLPRLLVLLMSLSKANFDDSKNIM